jgi:hypothetical protein
MKQFEMGLLDNAYDFVNESLRAAVRADRHARAWKFAVVHIVQAIELLLKERLRREHAVLVWENVDRQKNTVSLSLAVSRITGPLGIDLTARELGAIEKARRWRDLMIHYEFELRVQEVKAVYSRLFEFVTAFHADHLTGELHAHVNQELWAKEAELIDFFHSQFVVYNGTEVHRAIPRQILEAQGIVDYTVEGEQFPRIRYGSEEGWHHDLLAACGDCAVRVGELHLLGCDIEQCPRCSRQSLSCGCLYAERPEKTPLFSS